MTPEPCGVDSCPAFADGDDGFCIVHHGARRAAHVMAGTRCPRCKRLIESDEWITAASTAVDMEHAHCPPARLAFSRKKDRDKPLLADGVFTDGR